ncbi:hypothetical protein A2U01_0109446, partial [Trifolium medium]|nr:hypothetical protein [Trifolium medium]
DIAGPSNKSASAPMTRREMIAVLEANCKELDVNKLQFERMIHALKLEKATAEAASAGIDETMSDDAENDT